MDESEITIVPDIVARLDTTDNLIYTTRETVGNACEHANRANDMSKFAMRYTNTIKTTVDSYEAIIEQLQYRITEIEHKIKQLTGPCYCESLL